MGPATLSTSYLGYLGELLPARRGVLAELFDRMPAPHTGQMKPAQPLATVLYQLQQEGCLEFPLNLARK